jgi:uncharacterized membrane protein (Fun14 family)
VIFQSALPIGYLAYEGVVTVDWNRFYALVENGFATITSLAANLIQTTAIGLPMLGGFDAGFVIGFKQE